MTTVPEEAVKAMPERIFAKVHGASTDLISGQRGLIGGWNEHKRDGQIEYVRSDLIATYQAAVLEKAVQIAERPVIGFSDGAVEASKYIASSIRTISSPDHADAGKVEGDGWLPITEENEPPMDVEVILGWWQSFPEKAWITHVSRYGSTRGRWRHSEATHWLPLSILPSAPSQEVAGS